MLSALIPLFPVASSILLCLYFRNLTFFNVTINLNYAYFYHFLYSLFLFSIMLFLHYLIISFALYYVIVSYFIYLSFAIVSIDVATTVNIVPTTFTIVIISITFSPFHLKLIPFLLYHHLSINILLLKALYCSHSHQLWISLNLLLLNYLNY